MAKERILVIDDESALRLAREFSPDLVLLDIQLSGIGGIEVLEKIKAADPEIFAIMITAYGIVDTAVTAMKAGAFDYLSLEKLEDDLVRQALEQSRSNQTRAAQMLGISRDSLRYRMKKMGLMGGGEEP